MTEQNEREAAWLRWKPEFDISANKSAAKCGFYAGYAAGQPQWRPIRTADDLPKGIEIERQFLFQRRDGGCVASWFTSHSERPQYWVETYEAWQPIQPYTESDKGEIKL